MKNYSVRLLIFTFTAICGCMVVKAQESVSAVSPHANITQNPDVILTQYWAVPTMLNPAATGEIDFIRARVGARMELFGSHDSPKDFIGAVDAPFKLFGKKIGAGIIANAQTFDIYSNFLVAAQGSYKLKIKKSILSVGLQIGYFHSTFKGSEMKVTTGASGETNDEEEGAADEGENYFPTHDVSGGVFDLGLGIRYEHPWFNVGVSALHLTNSTMKMGKEGDSGSDSQYINSKQPLTLYFDAGGNIALNNTLISLQPSLLLATDFNDINCIAEFRATYNRKVTFGVDYRYNRAFGVIAGLFIKDFYVGYNWEYDYSSHPRGSTGNHELVLGYQFKIDNSGKNNFGHRSIRIM